MWAGDSYCLCSHGCDIHSSVFQMVAHLNREQGQAENIYLIFLYLMLCNFINFHLEYLTFFPKGKSRSQTEVWRGRVKKEVGLDNDMLRI